MARKLTPSTLTMYGFVGNPGCIRFPPAIRKVAGIKRGDRLIVVARDDVVLLERLEAPDELDAQDVGVEGCACEQPPEACGGDPAELVTVGWSYVQLNRELASEIGLLPDTPVRLVAEPSQITVERREHPVGLEPVERLACPP